MLIWHFKEYVHGVVAQRGIISDDLDAAARAELDVILTEILGLKRAVDWGLPWYRPLGGGLGEIRFSAGGVEHRVFGSFSYGMNFRMWIAATKARKKKGRQATDPPNAMETARRRREDYEQRGMGALRDYEEE
jgi:hypothetical protein